MKNDPAFPIHAKWDDLKDGRHKELVNFGISQHLYIATAALQGILTISKGAADQGIQFRVNLAYNYATTLLAKYEEKEKS